MRVLHFRRIFSVRSESFIYDTIAEMGRQGVDSPVLSVIRTNAATRPGQCSSLVSLPEALWGDTPVKRLFAGQAGGREPDRVIWPAVRRLLRRRVETERPDVICAHFGPDGCLIAPVARKLGVPLAIGFYGYDVSRLLHQAGPAWTRQYRRLFESAALVYGISDHVVGKLLALGSDPTRTKRLPLGVDVDRFEYRDPAADYGGGPVEVVHVGRLTAKKGPVQLVRAVAEARRRGADLRLTVVGGGELMRETRAAAAGLGEAVRVVGAVPHAEIAGILGRAHVYAQHCVTAPDGDMEGLGVSLIEASARGLPVVTTRHNGLPEVVLHGTTGLLSPEGDAEAMAANLAALAGEPARWTALGAAGRAHVEANYRLRDRVAALVDALRDIGR